jgi:hypothetical protein
VAGLRDALAEAGQGLPVIVAELVEAFGAEGMTDWLEGYAPHCRPEFLRAFAVAVAERLARERAAESSELEPEAKPPPHPLEGLPLLREDWAFVDDHTHGRRHRLALLTEYRRRWQEAAETEPVEHRRANAGRVAANRWLQGIKP